MAEAEARRRRAVWVVLLLLRLLHPAAVVHANTEVGSNDEGRNPFESRWSPATSVHGRRSPRLHRFVSPRASATPASARPRAHASASPQRPRAPRPTRGFPAAHPSARSGATLGEERRISPTAGAPAATLGEERRISPAAGARLVSFPTARPSCSTGASPRRPAPCRDPRLDPRRDLGERRPNAGNAATTIASPGSNEIYGAVGPARAPPPHPRLVPWHVSAAPCSRMQGHAMLGQVPPLLPNARKEGLDGGIVEDGKVQCGSFVQKLDQSDKK